MVSSGSRKDARRKYGSDAAGRRDGEALRRASTFRAFVLVAVAALLQVVLVPYLDLGFVAPAVSLLCVAVAAAGLREPAGLLVGFFGGVLVDALGSGLFGVYALSAVLAAALSSRAGLLEVGVSTRLRLAGVVALAVAAHDLASVAALGLTGGGWPPPASFALVGLLPDALLNGLLAYLVGGALLGFVLVKVKRWP